MDDRWEKLYRVQDWALGVLRAVDHGFYLSGGTALSRGYCHHRHSEDLDLFVNDRDEFPLWRDRCLDALLRACQSRADCSLQIVLREERFGRAFLRGEADLKLEFINDVPFRVGEPILHPVLGRLDTRENILASKVTALIDRDEPKDVADIYCLCCREGLSLTDALEAAEGKAAGIFPPFVARRLAEAADRGIPPVHWISAPSVTDFTEGIRSLADSLVG